MSQSARHAFIALAHLVEPGSRALGELVLRDGPVRALHLLAQGRAPNGLQRMVAPRLGAGDPYWLAELAQERADRLGARLACPTDVEWPSRLADLRALSQVGGTAVDRDTYPPLCLWLRGPWALATACERSVAIVGARASTSYGEHVAADLGYGLASRDWTVVSGGAFGIDAAAHRGALAAGGRTVAVLACGIDRPYPLAHAALFDRIGEEGLLLSEWPPGSDPHRERFLVRNRVIAALGLGTVMVEANARSGARFTLHRSRDLRRVTMAVPGPVTSAMSVGCHEELREPDAILVANVGHVIDAVGRIGDDLAPVVRAPESPRDRLTVLQRRVLDGVRPRKLLTAGDIAIIVGVSDDDARQALRILTRERFVTGIGEAYRLHRKTDGPRV